MRKIGFLFIALFSSQSIFGQDLEAATNDVCTCFEEPYALIEKLIGDFAVAQAHGDYASLAEKQGEMMEVLNSTSTCFEGLAEKYPDINQSEELQNQVMAAAEQQCPSPANSFNFGM